MHHHCEAPLIQELKGNIRVFCRVRPAAESENGETACEVPTSGDGASSSKYSLLLQHADLDCSSTRSQQHL
jgi:Microtubule binding